MPALPSRRSGCWPRPRQPGHLEHVTGGSGLLRDFAVAEFGERAADDVVDAWSPPPRGVLAPDHEPVPRAARPFLPTYGAVSHRWLTRPLVAFPTELRPDEEANFLPHVFAVGDDARRSNLLDVHGYPAADPGERSTCARRSSRQIETSLKRPCGVRCAAAAAEDGARDLPLEPGPRACWRASGSRRGTGSSSRSASRAGMGAPGSARGHRRSCRVRALASSDSRISSRWPRSSARSWTTRSASRSCSATTGRRRGARRSARG